MAGAQIGQGCDPKEVALGTFSVVMELLGILIVVKVTQMCTCGKIS